MTKIQWLSAASALSLSLTACNGAMPGNQEAKQKSATDAVEKVPEVAVTTDTSFLSGEEKQVVNLLIQAADLMSPIYLRQAAASNPDVRAKIAYDHAYAAQLGSVRGWLATDLRVLAQTVLVVLRAEGH